MEEVTNFEEVTLRVEVSSRGGGIEIDLSSFGYEGEKMSAYQNYLGGGMLGRINNSCTMGDDFMDDETLVTIALNLSRYFHRLSNPIEDEWASTSFEKLQNRSSSAY